VVAALHKGADTYGVGSGAAHLISGHSYAHHALEEELADFTGRARALLFSTGYMANQGAVTALLGKGDSIYQDRLNHASLIDAGILSRASFKRFPHADMDALQRQLVGHRQGEAMVVSDGVFSMDGDLAPLDTMSALCQEHTAWLMVDDAHGFGVLGKSGAGTLEHFNLDTQCVPLLMGTLGKALGTFGAFVAGSEELIETLIQCSRSYVYTTALPPAVAEATRASLRLVKSESWRRERLGQLIDRFRTAVTQMGLPLMDSPTPIQPILAGTSEQALAWSGRLEQQGILVSAIRPPTVPEGGARLRITLSAAHSDGHLDRLLEALAGLKCDCPE
ncbi:MAG: 8-amino-7-oxononanoate synthase, partial [Gammaproteobacteria bacterium]|nr:8-amino-7-oxononanoate synthase [Gammaproteobacteria bacterium]